MTYKGAERRASLVEAGVELLAEQGSAGVTHRGVAARAGANPGLVHYYFAGSAGLRRAVAEHAAARSIGAVTESLLTAADEAELVDGIARLLAGAAEDPGTARLTTELVGAAFTDPEVARALTTAMATARGEVAAWLGARHTDWSAEQTAGRAALLLATVDGAVLHRLLDPGLPVDCMVAGLVEMTAGADR